jgi:serine protease DegQ
MFQWISRAPALIRSIAAGLVWIGLAIPAGAAGDEVFCPVCGAPNPAANRFCTKDGSSIPPLEETRRTPGFVRSPGTYSAEEIQQVVERVSKSVVRISARTTTTYRYPVTWWKDDESEYYNLAMLGKITATDLDERLAGSGFAIEPGEIVTNAHVASPDGMQAALTVETLDGRTFPAKLVGVDPASDLALLRLETTEIPPLAWGDSTAVRVGQETWSIGNPLDIGLSVARGTISGLGGMRMGLNQIESFIHSDAHSTHGNSGGPLVDVLGRVLGVVDMGFDTEKGQGYAIPSQMARLVIDRLRRNGSYPRGYVGLHVRPIDSEAVKKFNIKRSAGSVVQAVLPGTPGAVAGFQPGDVLYGINGRHAPSTYLLQEAISSVGPSASVRLMVDRQGKEIELSVTTRLRPAAPRIDPLEELEGYLRVRFEEEPARKQVIVRNPARSQRAPGLFDGVWVKSVLPAQDWPAEAITHNYYKTRAKPTRIEGLRDLRAACARAYLGGRMAMTFEIDVPEYPIASVEFDELWPIIL